MKSLTFITGNAEKAVQLSRHLDFSVDHKKLDVHEIQSLNLEEVARYKAEQAYNQIKQPVLVEDTALTFNALGSLPGPLIKWFLTSLDNDGMCKLLESYSDRSAVAEVCFALYDGDEMLIFKGEAKGTISENPKGKEGFGWDPIFIPDGYKITWGEMDTEEQKKTSMRRIALKKLEAHLKNI